MAQMHPSAHQPDHPVRDLLDGRDAERQSDEHDSEMSALREENAELRKLVITLSELVIRNVLAHRH